MFIEEGFEEELGAAADDLIHSYLKGELARADRESFQAHFLASSRNRKRLAFIRDLGSAIQQVAHAAGQDTAAPVAAWQGLWPVAAALAALALGVPLMLTRPKVERSAAVLP